MQKTKTFYKTSFYSTNNTIMLIFIMLLSFSSFSQNDVFEVCRTGSLEDITKLYNQDKTIINAKNEHGYSALTLACYNGNEDVVRFLVDKVETVNSDSKYGSPLMAAVYKRNKNITKLLIDHNVDVNFQDSKGVTAAHYAVMFKMYDIVALFVNSKADFDLKNNKGETAKDYAVLYKDKKLIDLLNI